MIPACTKASNTWAVISAAKNFQMDSEVGVYLWMPPRLGRHRADVHLVVWDKGGKA